MRTAIYTGLGRLAMGGPVVVRKSGLFPVHGRPAPGHAVDAMPGVAGTDRCPWCRDTGPRGAPASPVMGRNYLEAVF